MSEPGGRRRRTTRLPSRRRRRNGSPRRSAAAIATRGRADWATTGGSSPVGIYRQLVGHAAARRASLADRSTSGGATTATCRATTRSRTSSRSTTSCSASATARKARPADLPGSPFPVDHVHPFPTGEAIGEARGAAWCAAALGDELRGESGPPTRAAGRSSTCSCSGSGRTGTCCRSSRARRPSTRRSPTSRWPIPAPTHIEPHVERVTLNPAVVGAARQVLVVATGAAKAAVLGEVFGADPRSGALAGPARPPRRRDLDPRRGGAADASRGDRPGVTLRRADPPADGDGAVGDVWLGRVVRDVRLPAGAPRRRRPRLAQGERCCPTTRSGSPPTSAAGSSAFLALSDTMVDQLYIDARTGSAAASASSLLDARQGAPPGRPRPLLLPGQRPRPALLRARGFSAIAEGDGSNNEEHQPDLRYAWRPMSEAEPTRVRRSRRDGHRGLPLRTARPARRSLLVHGTSADHTTFRVLGPRLADDVRRCTRSTGAVAAPRATPLPYAIEREFEDVVAVAEAVAGDAGGRSTSSGTRTAGGARSGRRSGPTAIRRVICYEGAPTPPGALVPPAGRRRGAGRGSWRPATADALLATFMRGSSA